MPADLSIVVSAKKRLITVTVPIPDELEGEIALQHAAPAAGIVAQSCLGHMAKHANPVEIRVIAQIAQNVLMQGARKVGEAETESLTWLPDEDS